jgi:hypothetical protein
MTTKSPKKLKFLSGEKWKELPTKKGAVRKRYAISNLGRIVSFIEKMDEGTLLKTSLTQRFPSVTLKISGKSQVYYIHRLVAEHFVRRPSSRHRFVIHLDHVKENNRAKNLKWVTHEDQIEHAKKDPVFSVENRTREYKLNESKVKQIKKKLKAGKTPMKVLAKQFGVTEMQLYRIKSGENWGHVKI